MKKTLAALALAAAGMVAVPAAFAQSAPPPHHDGWFVNGQVGRTQMNNDWYDGHDTGYQLTGGYRWALGQSTLLGIEGGYNDLGNINFDPGNVFNSNDVYNRTQSELHGWMLGANGHFNLNPNWYVSARAGLYQWKGHGLSNNENPLRRDLDKTDWYTGVGFGYDFASNFSVGLNYDYYHAKKDDVDLSTDMVSVGAEYRF
ncbi:MAG TPA: porin family protein [Oleiagrimonas sp.]|nr:porin family protein [Oleiagrimonas sp.]